MILIVAVGMVIYIYNYIYNVYIIYTVSLLTYILILFIYLYMCIYCNSVPSSHRAILVGASRPTDYGIRGGVSSSERILYLQQNSIAEKRAVLHVVCVGSFYLILGWYV